MSSGPLAKYERSSGPRPRKKSQRQPHTATAAFFTRVPPRIHSSPNTARNGSSISSQRNSGTSANSSGAVSAKSAVQESAQFACGSTRPKRARPPRHGKGGEQL